MYTQAQRPHMQIVPSSVSPQVNLKEYKYHQSMMNPLTFYLRQLVHDLWLRSERIGQE